jgi:hypothetical protein
MARLNVEPARKGGASCDSGDAAVSAYLPQSGGKKPLGLFYRILAKAFARGPLRRNVIADSFGMELNRIVGGQDIPATSCCII